MNTFCKNEWKPAGWSLVAGKFKGTNRTYFYLVRGNLMCGTPLTLQCPASEDGFVYSNPFTIEHVLARFGSQIDQDTMSKLGHYLPPKRELRILVGDELQDVTSSYLCGDIEIDPEKGSPKLKEAIDNWQATLKSVAAMNEAIKKGDDGLMNKVIAEVKNAGGIEIMGMNTVCKNGSMMNPLAEVLFYWHDEVHDRIDELIAREVKAVHEVSTKKAFVEQMAAQIVEFEREGGEDTAEFEAMAERRAERLRSLLMDWVEVPKVEDDKVRRLERMRKDALAQLEKEFESLFVRAKVVQTGGGIEWLRAVGVYGENGDNFDIKGDARRFISAVAGDSAEI